MSNARHLTGLGRRGGKAAVIAGAAAALLSTGTAIVANLSPVQVPTAIEIHKNPESLNYTYKPRTGSGRPPVRLGPGRRTVAGLLVRGRLSPASMPVS